MKWQKWLVSLFAAAMMSVQVFAGVNLNTADAEELTTLKGVGSATAAKIIEYRKDHRFKSIEEIMNIKGIGEKTFAKIKADLEV